ncbi:MAG: FecR domain-containing protein [Salibacteraceae bacterium]
MTSDNQNIDELLIAYLLGELDPQKINEVSEWIAMSEDNLKYFEEISRIWNPNISKQTPQFNADVAWNKVAPKIQVTPFYMKSWFRAAAAVIILFGAINLLLNLSSTTEPTVLFSETEIVNKTLEDGSEITLNKNSKISYTDNFNTDTRQVKLEGEAFFDIERDTNKPFIIELDQSFVKVLGTSFNIKSEPEDELVSVFVKSGVVLFEYASNTNDSSYLSVTLKAGDKVVYNKSTRKLEPVSQNESSSLDMYWMDQQLIFDGIELRKVAEILETVYEVDISFSEEQSKLCLLTANFQNATIDQIMEVIASTFELELNKNGQSYQLIGLSCEEN